MAVSNFTVNDYFDHVYVLNLEQRPDRLKQMQTRLASLDIAAEYVTAVNGYDFHNRLEYETYLQQPIGDAGDKEIRMGRKLIGTVGAWGCLKSYAVILEAARREGFRRILCLEDDAVFHREFQHRFARAMAAIPEDWKLLYLGAGQRNWAVPDDLAYPDDRGTVYDPAAPYYYPRRTFGTFALAYHQDAFDIMLRHIRKMTSPVDNGPVRAVVAAYPQKCFVLNPNLVIMDTAESDIRDSRDQSEVAQRLKWNLQDYQFAMPETNDRPFGAVLRDSTRRGRTNYRLECNILLQQQRAVFYIIPKTGCSSMKAELLAPLGMEEKDDIGEHLHDPKHYPFPFAESDSLLTDYRDYFRFAFVRNPWDRLVSCYRDKIRAPDYNEGSYTDGVDQPLQRFGAAFYGGMPFREFVDSVCALPDAVADNHFRSQLYQLTDPEGALLVNYIARFENMALSLADINAHTGLELTGATHLNKSSRSGTFRDYYDEELVEKVRQRFFADIHLLQYEFDAADVSPIGAVDREQWQERLSRANILSYFVEEKCRVLNRRVAVATSESLQLQEELKQLKRELRKRDRQIKRFRQSRTWKMTALLRRLARFRQGKKPGQSR